MPRDGTENRSQIRVKSLALGRAGIASALECRERNLDTELPPTIDAIAARSPVKRDHDDSLDRDDFGRLGRTRGRQCEPPRL